MIFLGFQSIASDGFTFCDQDPDSLIFKFNDAGELGDKSAGGIIDVERGGFEVSKRFGRCGPGLQVNFIDIIIFFGGGRRMAD